MKFTYELPALQDITCGDFAIGITALPEGDKGEKVQWTDDGD